MYREERRCSPWLGRIPRGVGRNGHKGFQFGSSILQFDATDDEQFLEIGRRNTLEKMAVHVTHIGVHDHGFNNVSTYGNLRRLMREGRIPHNDWECHFYELALKTSGAIQASRWSKIKMERAISVPLMGSIPCSLTLFVPCVHWRWDTAWGMC